jgi:putative component of membrane protein insertase Oxa1/YidC/SpoIIIJ protein YidD
MRRYGVDALDTFVPRCVGHSSVFRVAASMPQRDSYRVRLGTFCVGGSKIPDLNWVDGSAFDRLPFAESLSVVQQVTWCSQYEFRGVAKRCQGDALWLVAKRTNANKCSKSRRRESHFSGFGTTLAAPPTPARHRMSWPDEVARGGIATARCRTVLLLRNATCPFERTCSNAMAVNCLEGGRPACSPDLFSMGRHRPVAVHFEVSFEILGASREHRLFKHD